MVSIREIRRIFNLVAPDRQLTPEAIEEFQNRATMLIVQLAKSCEDIIGLDNKSSRLKAQHVQRAYLNIISESLNEIYNFGEENNE